MQRVSLESRGFGILFKFHFFLGIFDFFPFVWLCQSAVQILVTGSCFSFCFLVSGYLINVI